jgi:hypothetical protein
MEMAMSTMNNVLQDSNDVILKRKGPWIYIIDVAKEIDISTDELLNMIHYNEIAFIKPKQANESKIYLHRSWVKALKSGLPVAKYCMLQRHLLMDDYTEAEWKSRVPSKKPKKLATDIQKDTLMRILKSDFIMQGEEKWIFPIFNEKWLGYFRMRSLIEYFNGHEVRDFKNKRVYAQKGILELRRESLVKLHQNRITEPIDVNDWLPE